MLVYGSLINDSYAHVAASERTANDSLDCVEESPGIAFAPVLRG